MTRLPSMNQPQSEKLTRLLSYLEVDPDNTKLLGDALETALAEHATVADELALRITRLTDIDPGAAFALSNWHMHQQDWQAGAKVLQNLAQEYPINEAINYNLAQCFAYSGQFEHSFKTLKPLFGFEDRLPSANTSLLFARSAMHIAEYDVAESTLLMLQENESANDAALGLLALLYRDNLNSVKAIAYAQDALRLNPANADANLVLAETYLDDQDTTNAQKYFSLVLTNRKSHRALRGQAMIQLVHGNAETAEAGFAELFAIQQSTISDYHLLALAQLLQGHHKDALVTLAEALRQEPDNAESRLLKTMMLMLDQQSEQAKTVVREIKSNPNTKTLELAINSLEHALNGNEDQAKSLLLNLLGSQSPQGKTYGAVISRLLHSPKSNSVN
jgi:tetratricopeptide (TPR) repeat protein